MLLPEGEETNENIKRVMNGNQPSDQPTDADETYLSDLLQGEDFINEIQQKEQIAIERRQARKRRLEALANKDTYEDFTVGLSHESASDAQIRQQEKRLEVIEGYPSGKEDNDGSYLNENVDFDMFSTSVSPIHDTAPLAIPPDSTVHKTVNRAGKVDQQQDWDDVDGYYKV